MTQEAGVPADFWGRIQKMIDDAVAKLARSGMLRNASITGGALTIKEGGTLRVLYPATLGGGPGVFFGDIVGAITGNYLGTGMLIQAPDGTDMAVFRTDATLGTTMSNIYDSGDRIIFGNDAASGQGLARPYVGGAFAAHRFTDFRFSTTSA